MKTNSTQYKIVLFFVSVVILSIISAYFSILKSSINCNQNCNLVIYKNENAFNIGHRLDSLGLIDNYYSFVLASKLLSIDRNLKPGNYNLADIKNMQQLLMRLTIADRDYIKVTIPEGWTIEQISNFLEEKKLVNANKFNLLCNNHLFIKSLGFERLNSLEGYLFPETYFLSEGQNEEEIIQMMVNEFKKIINNLNLDNQFNFSMHDILTFASIVQGEARLKEEMEIISSVFHNRIKRNMSLDANATIQYIIPGKNRRLMNRDLEVDNLYNTYKYKGLPPGPINNPGLLAIKATLAPRKTNYIYFVKENKDAGSHVFSTNIRDHEKAKQKYLRSLK